MHLSSRNLNVFIILLVFCLIKTSQSENKENKLKDALRNNTNSKNNGKNNQNKDDNEESDNTLKSEAQKMLKQCGVEKEPNNKNDRYNNNNYRDEDNGRRRNPFGNNNGNDRYGNSRNNYYGNDGASSNNEDGEWNIYSSPGWNNNAGNHQNQYPNRRQSTFGNQHSNYGQTNSRNPNNYRNTNNHYGSSLGNRNEHDRTNYGYGASNGFNQEGSLYGSNNNQQGFGFRAPDRGYQGSSTNNYDTRSSYNPNRGGGLNNDDCVDNNNAFGYNGGMALGLKRPRRSGYFNREENEDNEDNQCISQCVFGYLHLLDGDQTPSETLLIKWLQENTTGNDMDRIKELREARRCFARLSTSDIDDGCEFSKELSKCLELELE